MGFRRPSPEPRLDPRALSRDPAGLPWLKRPRASEELREGLKREEDNLELALSLEDREYGQ